MKFLIYKEEAYPVYSLTEWKDEGERGWIPDQEIPAGVFTDEDWGDWQRVEALYEAWQDRLKVAYDSQGAET